MSVFKSLFTTTRLDEMTWSLLLQREYVSLLPTMTLLLYDAEKLTSLGLGRMRFLLGFRGV